MLGPHSTSVGMAHPVFPEWADFLLDQSLAERQLCTRRLDHSALPARRGALDADQLLLALELSAAAAVRLSAEISVPIS